LTLFASVITALAGAIVLAGWALDVSRAGSLVAGWRVMVPSTAFSFLCVGMGLAAASRLETTATRPTWTVRSFALGALVLPLCTFLEYLLGVRWGVESWLGFRFDAGPSDEVTGRMSPVTASCFLLLTGALGALTWPGRMGFRIVRLAGGSALAMSWLAVLAVSFDDTRLIDDPRFPGMAALTIGLFAVASIGVLACSSHVVSRLRDAHADVVIPRWLLSAAFVLPLAIGGARAALDQWINPGLSSAITAFLFALGITVGVWTVAARMLTLQRQREASLAELEARVAERTRDLTAANVQLRLGEEALKHADRRKDEFLATLSHELRNPLAPLRTGVQLLKMPSSSEVVKAQAFRVIDRQLDHLVRLIDDLLDVSRITADKLTLRHERLDLIAVIRQAVDGTRSSFERAGHRFDLHLPPDRVPVVGDATRLAQVISNLLQNACKYTPDGGHITLTATVDGDDVAVRVRDNGIGIPQPFLAQIFEKFSQVGSALDRSEGGLGLGLALVRGITTLHGGSVEALSDGPNRGSEFVVRLPVSTEPAAVEERTSTLAPSRVSRRVLVADDNADNTAALAMFLRARGHIVETALDGETAFATAEQFRPEVVFLDIGMPGANGYDVCRKLRQQDWGRQMRVFAQTGWGQTHDRELSQKAGFDGHLVKPVDPSQIDALLQG
jgi:signal transduction histidine kinase/CheY-like chemotaxis protein